MAVKYPVAIGNFQKKTDRQLSIRTAVIGAAGSEGPLWVGVRQNYPRLSVPFVTFDSVK
jgi:hypothetical protein